jgi:integrase/recombinase XerD
MSKVTMKSTTNSMQLAKQLFMLDCESRNLSPRTLESNNFILNEFTKHCETDNIAEVTSVHVRQYLAFKSETASKSTAKRYYTTLSPFFKFCLAEGMVDVNPVEHVGTPKAPRPIIQPLSCEQITALVEAESTRSFIGLRNRLMVLMFIDCGLRASELCNLDLDDLDLENRTLVVRHGKGDKARLVPFGNVTVKTLKQYVIRRGSIESEALVVNCYGERTTRDNILKTLWKISKKAGICRVHPHLLRHSMAVSYLRNGGDVFSLQKMLGHSSLEMTRQYSELANSDIIAKHRLHSPADSLSLRQESVQRRRIG